MVADASGYSIDSDGQKNGPKRGIVSHSMGSAWDGFTDNLRKFTAGDSIFKSESNTVDGTSDTSDGNQPNNNNGSPTESTSGVKDSDSSVHKNSFNSNNIPNSSTSGGGSQPKFMSDGAGGMKPNPNYVAPPEPKVSFLDKAKEAFSDNWTKGFSIDNLKAVGKASLPAVAIEAGAQGMQYVASNTTGNTQKVAQVGVDALNSDTAQFASIGGMIGGAIGGIGGFFGGFGVGALPGMAAGASIGTRLGASVGLLKDSLDGSMQTGNQNIKDGFNALGNMIGDFGTSVSQSVQSATNQISNIDVTKSFDNFMNNMGFGNSSVSSVTASALSQPSNFGGVNMMNSSAMPPMAQQSSEGWRGGITDPTSQITGLMNIAQAGTQQLANQQTQGELNQVSNQIDIVKNYMDKLVKNPPNTTSADVERIRREMSTRFVQK